MIHWRGKNGMNVETYYLLLYVYTHATAESEKKVRRLYGGVHKFIHIEYGTQKYTMI